MNDNHKEVFKEEAYELLTELETALLELETTPDDKDLIGKAFRAMHTIKGSGAMFGFDDVAGFTHEIETVFDKVREGDIPVTKTLISLTLQARDLIKMMLDASGGEAPSEPALQEIVSAFRKLVLADGEESPVTPPAGGSSSVQASPPLQQEISPDAQVTYRIRLSFSSDIFETGTNLLLLLDELRTLGECSVTADTNDIPYLDVMNPECCYTGWDVVLTTDKGINAIKDVFIFVEDRCEIKIDAIRTDGEEDHKKAGGDPRRTRRCRLRGCPARYSRKRSLLGEMLVEKGITTPRQGRLRPRRAAACKEDTRESSRQGRGHLHHKGAGREARRARQPRGGDGDGPGPAQPDRIAAAQQLISTRLRRRWRGSQPS